MNGRGGCGRVVAVRSILPVVCLLVCLSARSAVAADWEGLARWLDGEGIGYGEHWVPPGGGSAWKMDCSNTVRWLYREGRGELLPRTGSGQYEHFRRMGKVRRVRPDGRRLARELRRGDLLFWEHTYRPVRRPPVTHVMMYLGRDRAGRMWMAGAQGGGGVGVHEFRPRMAMGGYRWFLWFRREGRFVGYARP